MANKGQLRRASAVFLLLATACTSRGGVISVPNGSFEAPSTRFVSIAIDSWQRSPRPDWYQEGGGFLWEQLTGIFLNPLPSSPSHISNCDGAQAAWLFAVPEVALFQDLSAGGDPMPSEVRYEPGTSYQLKVGVIGGGGAMLEGVTLEIGFYYRDEASNAVTVASTSITNTTAVFTNLTHLVDFSVGVRTVEASDPWAGRPLGLRFASTVGFEMQGGYWDLDNVRLVSATQPEPVLRNISGAGGQFEFVLESEPGLEFEMLASPDPGLPVGEWTRVGTLSNETGRVTYVEPATNAPGRVFRARRLE